MFMKSMIMFLITVAFSTQAVARIDKFHKVSPGVYRGAQPTEFTDYEKLRLLGIRTIVNLRNDGRSESVVAKRAALGFYWSPMNAFGYPNDAQVEATLKVMNDPKYQPVFVHCEYGKDRTGLLIALHRVKYEGWSSDRAYNEMMSFGFNRIFVGYLTYYFKKTLTAAGNLILPVDRFAPDN
jgi:tyrosine-protein phosphatase SIW14